MSSNAGTMKKKSKRTLTPKLRFPAFRDAPGWEEKTGDSLFEQINQRNPAPDLPVLAITQEYGAIPRDMIDYHVTVTEKSIESYKVVQVGDFIISLRSFQGGIEYSQYHGICSPAYVILRRRTEGSDAYFKHYLKTDRFIQALTRNLEGLRDGKMISYKQFSELLLPVPSPPEQQKIADCLSSLDGLIAAEGKKLSALRDHKRGLMQQLFPQPGKTQPRLRFPEFRDKGEWEEKPLKAFFSFIRNGFVGTATPYYTDDGIPYLQGKNIKSGRIDRNNIVKISKDFHEKQKKSQLQVNDILMVQSGHVGECALVDEAHASANCHALIILSSETSPCPDFFLQLFYSEYGKEKIAEITTGNTVKHILASGVKALKLSVPILEERERISACLTALDDRIAAQAAKIDKLKQHKRGLMQQLFPAPEDQ